uniref:SUEL-type lectin domain-containing protein n=1 Tax=Branchiostoma floridae TaxID=7739 RepID=C3YEP4_BRAFL|eukprot:XP_002605128.1 hypothetical protein BRAFLDRAFT_80937 [Branchiostoma floridae]
MYTASTDKEELDTNKHGHTEEEPKVEQAGSTVAMNSNANRDADRSQPDTSEDDANDEAIRDDLSDDGDMQPYAVADIRDHETYLHTAALRARQTEGDTNNTGSDHDAQVAQNPCRKGFPNPMYRANAGQQASDDAEGFPNPMYRATAGQQASDNDEGFPNPLYGANVPQQASEDTGVHDIQSPSINANELKANPMYSTNAGQQAPDDANVRRCRLFAALAVALLLIGPLTTGILRGIRGTNPTNLGSINGTNPPNLQVGSIDGTNTSTLGSINGTNPTSHGSINYGTSPPTLGSINGTNPPKLGTIEGTNPSTLGGIIGTNAPNRRSINFTNAPTFGSINYGTNAPNHGSMDGTNPTNVGITNGTNPPALGSIDGTHGTNPVSCKTGGIDPPIQDKLLVIDDAFFGRRNRETMSGCKCGGWFSRCNLDMCGEREAGKTGDEAKVRRSCQGLQQCNMKVSMRSADFGDPCPKTNKYLEVTYHCEEQRERVSSRLATGGSYFIYGTTAGLAVSSDNEIFVTHSSIKTIQVFSMKGVKLRSIPTGDMTPYNIATGLNNSLWVVLQGGHENRPMYENAVNQYRKDGHILAKYNCNGRFIIHGIAVDKLNDRIILTIEHLSGGGLHREVAWFRPTHTQGTPTCNMTKFGSIEGELPLSITVDKRGNIFIADKYNDRVLKYDKNGVYISSFGSRGTGAGYLYWPSGVCVDSLGRVIVVDSGNARVEMFTADGDHVCTVAYINYPVRVAIGGEGQVVVATEWFVTILP